MNEEKKFVVKEVYAILPGEGQLGEGMFYKHLWKLPIPSKVKGLISRGTHNHLQTMGNLKKGKIIDDTTSFECISCNSSIEITTHLLFKCKFSYSIGARCYEWYGDERVLPADYFNHFWQHRGNINGKKTILAWGAVWASVIWALWKHRNDIKFNGVSRNLGVAMDALKHRAWTWCKANIHGFNSSLYILVVS
ncbi:hypothetical protein JHK86_004653 [Glycine max]|nr:hypothetical protein JHK86_004653 [Glycine max]